MHVLIAGWFSWELMGTTAGDFIAKDLVCSWLDEAGITYDVALAKPFSFAKGVDWQKVDAKKYSDVVFVCGPFRLTWPLPEFLDFFSHCRFIGVNLSMLQPLDECNPFTLLYERDSSATINPDLTFYAKTSKLPVVGVLLVHKQKEYGSKGMHDEANEAIKRLTDNINACIVPIDTMLEYNKGGLRTPEEIETLISKMDVVVTTRLHGTVLAIKNGVPAIPVDPVAGGAKITAQVKTIGWPILFQADKLNDEALMRAFEFCLTGEARLKTLECKANAISKIKVVHNKFLSDLTNLNSATYSEAVNTT